MKRPPEFDDHEFLRDLPGFPKGKFVGGEGKTHNPKVGLIHGYRVKKRFTKNARGEINGHVTWDAAGEQVLVQIDRGFDWDRDSSGSYAWIYVIRDEGKGWEVSKVAKTPRTFFSLGTEEIAGWLGVVLVSLNRKLRTDIGAVWVPGEGEPDEPDAPGDGDEMDDLKMYLAAANRHVIAARDEIQNALSLVGDDTDIDPPNDEEPPPCTWENVVVDQPDNDDPVLEYETTAVMTGVAMEEERGVLVGFSHPGWPVLMDQRNFADALMAYWDGQIWRLRSWEGIRPGHHWKKLDRTPPHGPGILKAFQGYVNNHRPDVELRSGQVIYLAACSGCRFGNEKKPNNPHERSNWARLVLP